jgi:hypothetical protein
MNPLKSRKIMARKTISSVAKRHVLAKLNKQKICDPNDFLSPKRLDIAAKTVFARAYLDGNTSKWPEAVYHEHIRAFNNFYEKEPLKNSYEDFKNSFIKTIESTKNDDSWKHRSPVPRKDYFPIDGAHRTAASIVLGDKINTSKPKDAQLHVYDYDYKHLSSAKNTVEGIDSSVLDYITVEYVSLKKKNIFVAVIFPRG